MRFRQPVVVIVVAADAKNLCDSDSKLLMARRRRDKRGTKIDNDGTFYSGGITLNLGVRKLQQIGPDFNLAGRNKR